MRQTRIKAQKGLLGKRNSDVLPSSCQSIAIFSFCLFKICLFFFIKEVQKTELTQALYDLKSVTLQMHVHTYILNTQVCPEICYNSGEKQNQKTLM